MRIIGNNDGFNTKRIKESYVLLNNLEHIIHKSCADRIPENFVKRDYIIDKIYDPRKSVGI